MDVIKRVLSSVWDFLFPRYPCKLDGKKFPTLQKLQDHYKKAHPGVRMPIEIKWS